MNRGEFKVNFSHAELSVLAEALEAENAKLKEELSAVTEGRDSFKDQLRKIAAGQDPIRAMTEGMGFVIELKQQLQAAREALQLLYDVQNGCPLPIPKYQTDWDEAMRRVQQVLGLHDEKGALGEDV